MSRRFSCCHGCRNRKVGCHGTCSKYLGEVEANDRARLERHMETVTRVKPDWEQRIRRIESRRAYLKRQGLKKGREQMKRIIGLHRCPVCREDIILSENPGTEQGDRVTFEAFHRCGGRVLSVWGFDSRREALDEMLDEIEAAAQTAKRGHKGQP